MWGDSEPPGKSQSGRKGSLTPPSTSHLLFFPHPICWHRHPPVPGCNMGITEGDAEQGLTGHATMCVGNPKMPHRCRPLRRAGEFPASALCSPEAWQHWPSRSLRGLEQEGRALQMEETASEATTRPLGQDPPPSLCSDLSTYLQDLGFPPCVMLACGFTCTCTFNKLLLWKS